MRKLTIKRNSSPWGCLTPIIVVCDERIIGSVRSGNSVTLQIDENRHDVYCYAEVRSSNYITKRTSDVVNIAEGNSNVSLVFSWGVNFKLRRA